MRKLILFSVFIAFLITIQSCAVDACINKGYFLSTYNNFNNDLEKNKDRYSEDDWESKDEKMRHFVDDCYPALQEKMTSEEKMKFWKKYVKYMFSRFSSKALTQIEIEDKKSPTDIYKEIIDSLEDQDLEELFKDVVGDDIEKALDDVLNEVNKWGDQLKDWLNRN